MEHQHLEDDYLYEDEDALSELRELRSKIGYAKKNGEIEEALNSYYEYVRENILKYSSHEAFRILPEYMEYYDAHPEFEKHKYYVMWAFKNILPVLDGYSELSLEDIKHYYDLYKSCCQKYGYSLRTYYQILEYYLFSTPQVTSLFGITMDEAHESAKKEPRDKLCDPEAVEAYYDFTYHLDIKDDDVSAKEIIAPYLKKENYYGSVPHQSYYYLARYYWNKEKYSESIQYAKKALIMIDNDYPDYQCFFYIRSILFDIISVRYKDKALRIFKKMLKCADQCQSECSAFTFFECSYRFFYRLEKSGIKTVHLRIPDNLKVDLSVRQNEYQTSELKQYFYDKAKAIAKKFDKQNNTNEFIDSLNEEPICRE